MKSSEFFRKLTSRYFWGNIAAMAAVVVAVCFGVKFGLDIYTHHGEAITLPDVKHKSFSDAQYILENMGMEVIVSDTGYVRNLPPDCILEQSPEAGTKVKSGHIIYLIVNAEHSPTITLPDVIDNSSLREAMAKLTAMGFKLAQPQYIPGEKDWVYGILVRGRHVTAGDKISIDDALVIQAGNGMRDAADSVDYIDVDDFSEDGMEGDVDEFHVVEEPPAEEQAEQPKPEEAKPHHPEQKTEKNP